ncbi:putative baseplate assembly protein [soil metagenome]
MSTQYRCGTEQRRLAVRTTLGADGLPVRNGIDYLEVTSADQRTLELVFLHPLPGEPDGVPAATDPANPPVLTPNNLVIEGGVRVRDIAVESVAAAGSVLTVTVDRAGDFSTYTLRLVAGLGSEEPPSGFDPQLSEVAFSFKADCPADFDCAPVDACPPERLPEPDIDYLAKDYASFRRLMLDRLALTLPHWQEQSAADLGIALVEVLAYTADHLSYQQDAVATEAYLGTARLRTSVRRHAKLLDYPMHEGASARAWVILEVEQGASMLLRGPRTLEGGVVEDTPGTLFVTRAVGLPPVLDKAGTDEALRQGARAFEAMHDLTLRSVFNELRFYTWGDEDCCLPRGATRASLRNPGDALADLAPGAVLLFEEVRGPDSGRPEDADPAQRHAVRLTEVAFTEDPLYPESAGDPPDAQRLRLAEIRWAAADALPFPLCLREVPDPGGTGERVPVSVARGNVLLVDEGLTLPPEPLPPVPERGRYRPRLSAGPIVREGQVSTAEGKRVPFDEEAPAASALEWDVRTAAPAVRLHEATASGRLWEPAPDLLDSDGFDDDFVVETEEDGTARLRFGDSVHGRAPAPGAVFTAIYRVGGGLAGNVGAEAIAHVVTPDPAIRRVRNLLPARGGADPEPLEQVRLDAPQAFRTQERAVTEADYAAAAQRHPAVQRAAATFRWTGSWHTVFLTVDRQGGLPVDADFEQELAGFLERFPLAGYDLEIEPPRFVPLDIAFTVCVAPGHLRAHVKAALLEALGSRDLPGGGRGLFHPDNLTFGHPVYLSQLVAAAMAVPGVQWVDTEVAAGKKNRFQRWGEPPRREWEEGVIRTARLEIARLDNDPSLPENGRLELFLEGGA